MINFREIQGLYPGMTSLRTLVAGIPGPREGNNGEEIFVTGAPPVSADPGLPSHWPALIMTLGKIHGEGNRNRGFF